MILQTVHDIDAAGGKISYDPNARPELMRDTAVRDAMKDVMNRSTYLMPSKTDLEFLFPNLSEDATIDHFLAAQNTKERLA
ncbi:MAG: hypothetical protein AB8B51_10640 [Sedimentitalea sp.]